MHDEFHITLLSSDSVNKYPDNVLSSFTNYMDRSITLSGRWEVGITEIFHNKFAPSHLFQEVSYISVSTENHENNTMQCNDIQIGSSSQDTGWDMFYIHSDIIKPRAVGDQMVRCLKVLPTNSKKEGYHKFGRVEYYPVESTYIRSISIMILDVESNRINFLKNFLPTMITLHFKRKSI